MIGVSFEILAQTPVPKLPASAVDLGFMCSHIISRGGWRGEGGGG